MNREIEFRGKRLDNDEWVYGDLMHDNRGGCYVYPLDCHALSVENKVDPDTVGQFTSFYDDDGQKIYEGDILTVEGIKIDRRYAVTWNSQKYSFYIGNSPIIAYLDRIGNKIEGYRVIGNIHDNLELLSAK